MLGVPATTSTPDSTDRASHPGRPYSVSQIAVATPSGAAIIVPSTVRRNVPMTGSRKPPLRDCSRSASGLSNSSSGRRYWMPRTAL